MISKEDQEKDEEVEEEIIQEEPIKYLELGEDYYSLAFCSNLKQNEFTVIEKSKCFKKAIFIFLLQTTLVFVILFEQVYFVADKDLHGSVLDDLTPPENPT